MNDPDTRALIAAASDYATTFGAVPPAEREDLDAQLEDAEPATRNLITMALWSHSYEAFRTAVRRELLTVIEGAAR